MAPPTNLILFYQLFMSILQQQPIKPAQSLKKIFLKRLTK